MEAPKRQQATGSNSIQVSSAILQDKYMNLLSQSGLRIILKKIIYSINRNLALGKVYRVNQP